jgi:hypothetical protein
MANTLLKELDKGLIISLGEGILSISTNAKGLPYHLLCYHLRLPSNCSLEVRMGLATKDLIEHLLIKMVPRQI